MTTPGEKKPFFENASAIRDSWAEFLAAFKEEVYPVFAKHGVSIDTALMLYKLNAMDNGVTDALTRPDDGDEWKGR